MRYTFFLLSLLLATACANKQEDDLPDWVKNPSSRDTETRKAFVGHAEGVHNQVMVVILATQDAIDTAQEYMNCEEVDCKGEDATSIQNHIITHTVDLGRGLEAEVYEAYSLVMIPRTILKNSPSQATGPKVST